MPAQPDAGSNDALASMDRSPITSTANPLAKRVRALLAQRTRRQEEGAFVVEGIHPVWRAVESSAAVECLIVAPELLHSEPARSMVLEQGHAGMSVITVSSAVFQSFTEREHPSGLAAILRMPHRSLAELQVTPEALFVALHEAGNPGNLGTIIRTAAAVAGAGVITIGASADPYHPTAVKAAMGALFTAPVVQLPDLAALLAWSQRQGITVVTTSSHADQAHWSSTYPLPCVLLFGSEAEGLSEEVLAQGDLAVRIPMDEATGSLNLAVAVGILLYEVRRGQR